MEDKYETKAAVPTFLKGDIWEDNRNFLRYQRIFDVTYFSFIANLLSLTNTPPMTDPQAIFQDDEGIEYNTKAYIFFRLLCNSTGWVVLLEDCVSRKGQNNSFRFCQTTEKEIPRPCSSKFHFSWIHFVQASKWFLQQLMHFPDPNSTKNLFTQVMLECPGIVLHLD